MLDEELGFHPKHERVKSNQVQSYTGWDGEYGPFFQKVRNKLHVNYVAIERSDYVVHSLAVEFEFVDSRGPERRAHRSQSGSGSVSTSP